MSNTTRNAFLGTVVLAALGSPMAASAQIAEEELGSPWGELFVHGEFAVPVGDFAYEANLGWGGGLGALVYLHQERLAALRVEGSLLSFGGESFGHDWDDDVFFAEDGDEWHYGEDHDGYRGGSSNYLGSIGVGPQVYLASGTIRPYVFGTVGMSYFSARQGISSSYAGLEDGEIEHFAVPVEADFDEWSLSLKGGAGLSVLLSDGARPWSMDMSASYQNTGASGHFIWTDFDEPGIPEGHGRFRDRHYRGAFAPMPNRSSQLTFRFGVSVGVS